MGLQIIIRGKNKYGRTRAEQEANLRKDGFRGMEDTNFEKLRWIEKKTGLKDGFVDQARVEKVR